MTKKFIIKKNIYECSCLFHKIGICKPNIEFYKNDKISDKQLFLLCVKRRCKKYIFEKINEKIDDYIEDIMTFKRKQKLKK